MSSRAGEVSTRSSTASEPGATATTLTYPLDLLRARFAAGAETHKKAAIEDLVDIIKKRGVRGLASGLTPTLLGIMPYAGISFATFETLKAASIKIKHHQCQKNTIAL